MAGLGLGSGFRWGNLSLLVTGEDVLSGSDCSLSQTGPGKVPGRPGGGNKST